MPDSDRRDDPSRPPRGRVPSGVLASTLVAEVDAAMRVLEAARRESERNPAPTDALILEKYGPQFDAAMQALGETLADFFGESSRPPDLDTIRSKFLEPILSLSHSLPIFRRAEEWQRNKDKTGSLHPSLLEGRAIGFDAETLVLDHFYQNTIFARSLRSRVASLARLLTEEVRRRRAATGEEVRLLILGANSVLQFPLAQGRVLQTPLFAMIVDDDTAALRTARKTVEATLGIRPAVLRAKPYDLVAHIGQLGRPFDIACTLLQYDLLPPEAALKVTAAAWEVLKPGGAFFTGVYLKTVPRSAHALSRAIIDLDWQYWDEEAWRALLSRLPYAVSESRFETHPPATLVVAARKREATP